MDYRRIEQLAVTFQPGQMRLTLPFTLIDDTITEPKEAFALLVSRKLNNPNLLLGIDSAIITIEETDGEILCLFYSFVYHSLYCTVVEIRFNQTVYIVDEGGSVSVCVDIVGSVVVDDDLTLFLTIVTTGAGTASGENHLCSFSYKISACLLSFIVTILPHSFLLLLSLSLSCS